MVKLGAPIDNINRVIGKVWYRLRYYNYKKFEFETKDKPPELSQPKSRARLSLEAQQYLDNSLHTLEVGG